MHFNSLQKRLFGFASTLCFFAVLTGGTAQAATLNVPSQYATIQAAIDAAVPDDEVVVADGTYTGTGNKDLDFFGKAITVRSSSGDPTACIIDCQRSGRGFYFHSDETAASIVEGFTIQNGSASGYGGGVWFGPYCSPTLANCIISGNNAPTPLSYGGGVFCYGANPTLTNCTISGNTASYGGGMFCSDSSCPTLSNCTISANTATDGGGLYCGFSNLTLTNCILWGDTPQEIYVVSSTPVVTYCDVQGGYTGTGNININPQFALADNFHLMAGSPCIDAGTNSPFGGLPLHDGEGNPRVLDGNNDGSAVVDMGAYEFNAAAPSIAVSTSPMTLSAPEATVGMHPKIVSIRNCGASVLSWTLEWDASWLHADVVQGESTGEVDTVTLTADASALPIGTYQTTLSVTDPQASNNPRTVEIVLYVGTTLNVPSQYATIQAAIDAAAWGSDLVVADGVYMGTSNTNLDFFGKAITLRSESGNPAACIVDCQGSGGGFYFHSGETLDAVVEGFTIRNGSPYGGGVICSSYSSPTLTNCTITGNTASFVYGVYCYSFSNPTLTNCTITENSGRGVWCDSSSPMLTNCTISKNAGNGVYCSSFSQPTLTNCTISKNSGRGVYCDRSSPILTNCTISKTLGPGVYCSSSRPTLTNCTISGNMGDGLYCGFSNPTLTNCILWGDTFEIYLNSGTPIVTFCDVQGGWTGTGNINANPRFVDAASGNYHLLPNSLCIDAGSNAAIPAGIMNDLDGLPRIIRGKPLHITLPRPGQPVPPPPLPAVDMGAYEFMPSPLPEADEVPIGSPVMKPGGRMDAATSPTSSAGIRR